MPEAVLAGVATHWREFGQAPDRALALHCSLAHSGAWAGFAQHVPGLTITAPDLIGHGRSADWQGSGDYHTAATRQAMAMLARMEPGPVHLIGHSFGATIALRMALEDESRIASLTLFEPVLFCAARAAGGPAFARHLATHEPFADAYARGDMPAAAEAFQAIWGRGERFDSLPPAQRDYIIRRIGLIVEQNPALLEDSAAVLGYGRLEGLGVPVLLAQGGESPPIIDTVNAELARRLPQVRRASVAGAGHMLPITHAAESGALVSAFLAETCAA